MIRWTSRIKFLFLLPAVLWVLTFTVFPLIYSLYLSFHDVERKVVITGREQVPVVDEAGNVVLKRDGAPRTRTVVKRELQTTFTWNNFASFVRAFGDEEVHKAVKVTAIFVIAAVATEIVLGLALAWLFNRRIFGRPVLRSIMVLPIFASLLRIPASLQESAQSLGATPWQVLRQIVWPLSIPGVFGGTVLVFSLSMSAFVTPLMLGSPSTSMISQVAAEQFLVQLNFPLGSAVVVLLTALTFGIVAAYAFVVRKLFHVHV